MPRIADYIVISDEKKKIDSQGDIDQSFTFSLESGAHSASRSILQFVLFVNGVNEVALQSFEVRINGGQPELTYVFIGRGKVFTLHEVIAANKLKVQNNVVQFKLVLGAGNFEIADVVLHYQRDI